MSWNAHHWRPRLGMRWAKGPLCHRRSPFLSLALIYSISQKAKANVDMGVFGPLLCPLDEAGRADTQAAEQVAQHW